MQRVMTISPQAVSMLFEAAVEKGILKGKREALLARLENLASDLFPGGTNLFSALSRRRKSDGASAGATPWEIGARFLELRGASREERRREGRFYTPLAVIDRIVALLWNELFPAVDFEPGREAAICDPAMGCGFFPLRLVELVQTRFEPEAKLLRDWAGRSLYGVDMDPFAVFMARALLWLALSDQDGEFLPDPGRFVCGEALLGNGFGEAGKTAVAAPEGSLDWEKAFPEVAAAGGFNILFGNPPYEVLTNFQAKPEARRLAAALRESGFYHDSLSGQVNLYRCFIERAIALAKPGGAVSFIVPLSLTRDTAAGNLRRRLLREHRAGRWRLYGESDDVFPGVTQSACIFHATRDGGAADVLNIARADAPFEELTLSEIEGFGPGGDAIPSPGSGGLRLFRWFRDTISGTLADLAESHVGEVDQTFYRECMSDEPTGCVLARGAHLSPFHVDVEPIPGKERFLRLERFLEMKRRQAERCVERASRPRVAQLGIRNMHSRPRLVASVLPAGVYAGNSLNMYYPRRDVPIEFVAGVLNSRIVDWLFRAASGNNNINLHEMRGLPFPDRDDPDIIAAVCLAYSLCVSAAPATNNAETELGDARMALDRAVADCYGLPGDLYEELMRQP